MNKRFLKGIIFTLLGGTLWGFSGVCGEYLFNEKGMTSAFLVPVRLFTAGLILIFADIIIYKKKTFIFFKEKRNVIDIIIYSVFGVSACQYTYFLTIQHSNAGTATVLQYIFPVLIMIWVCIKKKCFPKASEIVSVLLVIIGIVLIATNGNLKSVNINSTALISGILSGFFVAFYNLQPQRMMKKYSTNIILGWGMLIGGVILGVIMQPWKYSITFDFGTISALAGVVVGGTVLAFSLYMYGVKLIGAVYASMISAVEPISATFISAIWLQNEFTLPVLIGFIFIISTIFIIAYQNLKKDREV